VTTPPRQGEFPEPAPEALEELARQAEAAVEQLLKSEPASEAALEELARQAERAADALLAENYPAP
jgi:hypothetical protein